MENNTLQFILNKYGANGKESPIKLPMDRFKLFPSTMKEMGFKTGAEVGVLTGKYSKWLCTKIRGLKLYLIDPYVSYKEYSEFRTPEDMKRYEKEARERVAQFDCKFIKKFSMDAVKDFADESLDFVFIDANHSFEYCYDDIREWSKKVRKGGIVSGHDYSPYMWGVKKAVDKWVGENNINPLFLIGQNVWFYVKA